jgi:Transposase DDE domain
VNPIGVVTGFGPASTHDQPLAATLFAARQHPTTLLLSAGVPAQGYYVADKGFSGARPRRRWKEQGQAQIVTPPHQTSKRERWPKALRSFLASIRQSIETVNDKLLNTFRLARERPHDLTGFQARLAAKVSLHNFCIWFNLHLGRAPLAKARVARLVMWVPISHQTFPLSIAYSLTGTDGLRFLDVSELRTSRVSRSCL